MKRQRTRRVDPIKVSDLGEDFFKYVAVNHPDWHSPWEMEELRNCFKKEYAPSLLYQPGAPSKPACGFGTMIHWLKRQRKVKCSRHGKISFYEKTGYATVDQHRRLVRKEGSDRVVQQNREYPALCDECGVSVNSASQQQDHIQGVRHRLNLTKQYLKKNRDQLFEDKHGVSIVSGDGYDVVDGKIAIKVNEGEIVVTDLVIRCSVEPVTLLLVTPLVVDSRVNISDAKGVSEGKVSLIFQPGDGYKVQVRCEASNFGEIRTPIAFAFKLSSSETFHIVRNVVFSVSGEHQEDLQQTAPYSRSSKIRLDPFSKDVLPGIQFSFSDGGKLTQKVDLDHYNIPKDVNKHLNSNKPEQLEEISSTLGVDNYSQKFHNLVYAEEHQMKVDITRYDMKGAKMTKSKQHRGLLNLEVPGLAENRPSVLRGDHLLAAKSEGSRDKTYKGYVHHLEQEVVSLSFHESLVSSFIENMTFDIQFTFSRYPLRLQHHAVDPVNFKKDEMRSVLFPVNPGYQPTDPEEIKSFKDKLFDKKLAGNTEQVQAIYHIHKGSSRPAPYLVFGPPGTGKTVTIVEAMKQVYQSKTTFVLACAPSNSAADLIAKRVLGNGPVSKSSLLRMSASSRSWEAVDPELKDKFRECLNYDVNRSIYFPSADEIKGKRIVVTTMVTAGRLVLSGSFKNHFTHIFLDEAGHAVEPEALIPISGLLPKDGQLVMAGDPQQLGPVLRSPVSKKYGLELSLLERLMTTEKAYERQQNGKYNDHLLTKLLRNYRSHPAILEKPNEMFYDGELLVCADEIVRNSLLTFDQLPSKKFPIIFHGIEGKDEREENSPSFFNVAEAEQVMKYVNELLTKRGGQAIKKRDIGIISPYRKQVQKIQKMMRKNLADIKVGSVEEFQGQERLIIIISTVRSTREEFLQLDRDYKLGFLKNPKRFNVAITRAKALLICIGNPHMLSKDEHWNGFLRYCLDNNAYTGCPYIPDTEETEMNALTEKMARLNIPQLDFTEEEAAAVSDPEWRGDV